MLLKFNRTVRNLKSLRNYINNYLNSWISTQINSYLNSAEILDLRSECLSKSHYYLKHHLNTLFYSKDYGYYIINLNNKEMVLPVNSIHKLELYFQFKKLEFIILNVNHHETEVDSLYTLLEIENIFLLNKNCSNSTL